jgi:hypothetical protein
MGLQREIEAFEAGITALTNVISRGSLHYDTTSMTSYRFRVKLDWAPTDLWRDIVIGGERSLTDFQTTINNAVGLNQVHLWFIGTDEEY